MKSKSLLRRKLEFFRDTKDFIVGRTALRRNFSRLKSVNLVHIGKFSYGIPLVYNWDDKSILQIGNFVSIADNVTFILGGEHRLDWVTTSPLMEFSSFYQFTRHIEGHPASKGDIVVGNDVWIGTGAIILSGVTIGDGAVIGAGSLVSRDVPDFAVVGGNPATIIKVRFDKETCNSLRRISWWNWPENEIRDNINLILNSPEELIQKFQA